MATAFSPIHPRGKRLTLQSRNMMLQYGICSESPNPFWHWVYGVLSNICNWQIDRRTKTLNHDHFKDKNNNNLRGGMEREIDIESDNKIKECKLLIHLLFKTQNGRLISKTKQQQPPRRDGNGNQYWKWQQKKGVQAFNSFVVQNTKWQYDETIE